ncbi:GNAT family N-acetyltransferase [Streptomyces sp. NPDC046805]|uniref:GNAT family N-acetyltransferase n=1 Tax=Streptomyces sp. NPDC046805 TaxID=3155134 RepID=UPI0033F24CDE
MDLRTRDDYVIRAIRPDEWPEVKRLRLDALRDPAAPIAFMESYEEAVTEPDSFWQGRATRSGEGARGVRQFITEAPDGTWAATVTMVMEEAGTTDWAGSPVEVTQGHVVGVFVRPEHRGRGLLEALCEAALEWAWERGAQRVRLLVHEDNGRAQAAYRKAGFVPSGVVVDLVAYQGQRELEFVVGRG